MILLRCIHHSMISSISMAHQHFRPFQFSLLGQRMTRQHNFPVCTSWFQVHSYPMRPFFPCLHKLERGPPASSVIPVTPSSTLKFIFSFGWGSSCADQHVTTHSSKTDSICFSTGHSSCLPFIFHSVLLSLSLSPPVCLDASLSPVCRLPISHDRPAVVLCRPLSSEYVRQC